MKILLLICSWLPVLIAVLVTVLIAVLGAILVAVLVAGFVLQSLKGLDNPSCVCQLA